MYMPRLLLVEDEEKIAESLCRGLREQGYQVDVAYDGIKAKQLFEEYGYDLCLLDINIPLLNGYELCAHIRRLNTEVHIIMLTALSATEDKLQGFQLGADDYIVKPFDFKELVARIGVQLKRAVQDSPRWLSVANLRLNLDSKEVFRDDKPILLTAKEFQLLEYFIRHKNKLVSRTEIASEVWEIDFDTKTNVIDVYVNFLRKKVDRDFQPKLIHTQIGRGYILKDH
jgi:two-component system copper resistance phosphate regulon response regulator CusR